MLETDARDRVIVALDCDRERALELAHELSGHAAWLKVGMTLYYAEGPEIVKTFKDLGFKVFLDLKFHDIPHQVRGAARSASLAGADLLSVHGLGSGAMLAACREGAEEAREDRAKLVALLEPERIGVVLSEELQLHPEQSTSALVIFNPKAKYFSV